MLSEGGEENAIYHAFAASFKRIIKRAGTESGTSSIIKSGQKDTETSIPNEMKRSQLYGRCLYHVIFIFTRRLEIRQSYDLLRNVGLTVL